MVNILFAKINQNQFFRCDGYLIICCLGLTFVTLAEFLPIFHDHVFSTVFYTQLFPLSSIQ
jgi:hypothetical protein